MTLLRKLLIFAAVFATCLRGEERPNLVVFIADDISWNDFGAYGNTAARTPHIDRLATNGLRFDHVYLTASSCSPSRASILTGRYPHNTGEASELHRPWAAHLPTFVELLRDAGYYTAQAGKYHLDQIPQADGSKRLDRAFDRTEPLTRLPGNSGGHGRWLDVTRERPRDQPFFFWFAAIDAHREWDGDREWDEAAYGPKHDPARMIVPPYLINTPDTRADLASYHNEVTRFDHFVGKVVAELAAQRVLHDTLIVVMADNGRAFPRAKIRLHDSGMKTPFIVHWPAGIHDPGQTRQSLVSAIDLAPTFLGLGNVAPTATFQGVDFLPVIRDDTPVRRYAFSEHNWHDYEAHGRSLRTADGWLYVRNARPDRAWLGPADAVSSPSHRDLQAARATDTLTPAQADVFLAPREPEELYFSPDDPWQIHNAIGTPGLGALHAKLAAVMDQWQEETHDSAPEDYTPDHFDRVTGYLDQATGRPVHELRQPQYRTAPGSDRNASTIDAPGPR